MHVLSDRAGLPLVVGLSADNTHDSHGLKPMVAGLQTRHDPENGWHYKPRKLHADKAYDIPDLRRWLRGKRIGVPIQPVRWGTKPWRNVMRVIPPDRCVTRLPCIPRA
jgi:hypothetical protein